MICGSCGMRMDGGAVLACKTRMYEIAQAGHVPVISAMGNLPDRQGPRRRHGSVLGRSCRRSQPYLQPALDQADEGENIVSQEQMNVDPQGVALHQLRLLRLGVQLDGVRPRLPRPGRAREGMRFVGDPRDGATIERLERYSERARDLGLHALLLLQRALPEGRRPARRDREARRRGDEGTASTATWARSTRSGSSRSREDDRLAARDRARAEDAGRREGDQGDQVRDVARCRRARCRRRSRRTSRPTSASRARCTTSSRTRAATARRHRPGREGAPPPPARAGSSTRRRAARDPYDDPSSFRREPYLPERRRSRAT